jgi:membrane protein DedA with SNARE-associated domain
MEHAVAPAIAAVAAHPHWAAAIVFATAFGESFVFLSLLFPGTSMLVAAGALISAGSLSYSPVLMAALLGAVLGDAAAFWIGRRFGGAVAGVWPFTRRPELLAGGVRYFVRHGGKSVFIGRFFGPLRSVVPLAAGMMRMPAGRFWLANLSSAIVWAPLVLFFGDAIGALGARLFGRAAALAVVIPVVLAFGVLGLAVVLWRLRHRP